ncbi:MAG TPA: hypothetical protein VEW48_28175 [Thermoanaerobaculia bacterium]|nr:hypothetical protein [Thermoanaerobaculia bacterium]
MPNNSSRADTVVGAEDLLAAVDGNPGLLPDIGRHRDPVVDALSEVKSLSIQQQALTADRQSVTQKLKAATRKLKDLTMHLRAAVRADIGMRNEKLVQFDVAPLRPRPRKPKPAEPEAAKSPEAGAAKPAEP